MGEPQQAVDIGDISELKGSAQILRDKPYKANLEFAIQDHKRAIKLDKKNFQSYYGLGIIYSHLKNFEKSEENYLKAISIDSESSVAHNNLANLYNQINQHYHVKMNYSF